MSKFTTRIELHYASDDDYSNLHSAMERRGFTRLITSSDGVTYHLPTAEYNLEKNWDTDRVLAEAKAAAQSTGRDYEVLITESSGRKWYGLQKD